MRDLERARECWQEVKQYGSLRELSDAVRLNGSSSIATRGCRSACWKTFLLFDTLDTTTWPRTLSSSRSAYNSLRTHFLRHLENPDELALGYDPLSEETESSPWQQIHKDEGLRAEIMQDVERCMPENLYFRQTQTQRMLLDILFIFSKLNPDVSYRQGMHELLAPVLWVVERDAIDLGQSSKALGEDAVIKAVFDAEHIEHDTFALFGQLMQNTKTFYEQTTISGKENPIVMRSRRICSEMLPLVDSKLAQHLESIDIVPQVFLMRWIRLLFGREFAFDDMLTVWDVIFAEDTTLEIVDHICLTMLLRIRWELIDADYNAALTLLLRYPEVDKDFPSQTFVIDALYLREHMDQHGGSYLVSNYTGRPQEQAGRPVTPPALQRNITTFSVAHVRKGTLSPNLSPSRTIRPPRNIEGMLQSTAKNIYARSEKLGIGKVVRSAVDEVHRKAQEIRDTQTPSPPTMWRQRGPRGSLGAASSQNRMEQLENRSKQLAKLLEGAVSELWEYQRVLSESTLDSEKREEPSVIEDLSVAIAKVQFVQVYLDDPGLPLPQEQVDQAEKIHELHGDQPSAKESNPELHLENSNNELSTSERSPTKNTTDAPSPLPSQIEFHEHQVSGLADPSTFEEFSQTSQDPQSEVQIPKFVVNLENSTTDTGTSSTPKPDPIESSPKSRPRLEQSPLSWMLGDQEPSSRPFTNASSFPPEHGRSKASLFGESEQRSDNGSRERRSSSKPQKEALSHLGSQDGGGEIFDLGSLRHGKK